MTRGGWLAHTGATAASPPRRCTPPPLEAAPHLPPQELEKLTKTCVEREHLSRKMLASILHAMESGKTFDAAHEAALKEHPTSA